MIVCVLSSATLLKNVLKCAGPMIESEYQRHPQSYPFMLDGGFIPVKKILFVTWEGYEYFSDKRKIEEVNHSTRTL